STSIIYIAMWFHIKYNPASELKAKVPVFENFLNRGLS
ncbi:uncharacterized protein METZ01_LOCUS240606, partial [marine metagenome]